MNAPLSKKLNDVKWGEFKIGDLFEIQKISNMLSKEDLSDDYIYPAYSSDSENNGIIGYTNSPEFICDEKHPVYITFGDHTRTLNIARKSFSVLDNVKVLLPCTNKNNSLLFMISVWKKQIPNLGYARHWKVAKNCILSLPVTPENKIDFDFMEAFIRELEEERIRELEEERIRELAAYLKVSGFDNYTLSKCESEALAHFNELKWKEFRIGDLFEKQNLKFKKCNFDKEKDVSKIRTEEYSLPLVNAKDGDNGIMYYGRSEDFENVEMAIDIVNDGAVSTGNVYSQPQKTGVLYNAYLIKSIKHKDCRESLFYFTTAIKKSIKQKFCYEFKATWERVKEEMIFLPVKNDEIDYAFMETFIIAVQKLVIKDVVLYADKKIAATKQAVHKNPSDYTPPEGFGALEVAENC